MVSFPNAENVVKPPSTPMNASIPAEQVAEDGAKRTAEDDQCDTHCIVEVTYSR